MSGVVEYNYKKRRAQVEAAAGQLTTEEFKKLRRLCKTNLFFLTYTILGYDKLSSDLHGDLCLWTDSTQTERFRGLLWPRGHYKSTVWTIAHTIQSFLPDDVGDQPWPYCLGTDVRIVIAHEVKEVASRFLGAITQHVEENDKLLTLFPEILPDRNIHTVNKDALQLPRRGFYPEPTVDTMGVGARAQSKHFNIIRLDDIIGDKARDSPTEMAAANEWVDNIQAFFSSFTEDHLLASGTRWATNDTWQHIKESYGSSMKWHIRGFWKKDAEDKYVRDEKNERVPIFPEQFTAESIATVMKNRRVWTAQYLNDPKDGAGDFQASWLRYYFWSDVKARKLVYSPIPGTVYEHNASELDVCFLVDPAVSGETGFIVTGMNASGTVFTLETVKKAWSPNAFIDFLFQRVLFWQPRIVGIESVNFSALYEPWLLREMAFRRIRFRVEPLKTQNRTKGARILGLSNYWANGQIYINQTQAELKEEFEDFNPLNCDHMHLLDAFAHGPQIWKPYSGLKSNTTHMAEMHAEILSRRDPLTGYTPIVFQRESY